MATWRYYNAGTADLLTVSGTTLTDLPETKSITGTAFYQTARAKCFDLPATNEIWAKFDVYFDGSNRWRAFNGGDNSNPYNVGVTAQNGSFIGILSLVQNSAVIQDTENVCKTNQLQTVLLHMISSSSDGIVEAWVDGTKIYTFTGDVNHGEDFADLYLQSDGSGTFFSNVIVSNAQIGLGEGAQLLLFDVERKDVNDAFKAFARQHLIAYLPFDSSTTQDLCGGTWTTSGNATLSTDIKFSGASSIHLPSGAYLRAENIIDLNATKWTFHCQCYRVSSSGDEGFFGFGEGASRRGIIAGHDGVYIASSGGGSWQTQNSSLRLPSVTGQWKHLAIVKDGTSLKFFEGGSLVWDATIAGLNDTGVFLLGGNSYGYTNDLYFDEVCFYEGAALWSENFTPPTAEDHEAEGYPFRCEADCERVIFNENLQIVSYLKAYLPFDDSPTKDLCGNIWYQKGSAEINDTGAIHCNALQINNKSLSMGAPSLYLEGGITLGGRDFTIKFCANVFEFPQRAGETGTFFVLSPTAGSLLDDLTSNTATLYLGVSPGGGLTVGCLGNFNSNVATLELGRTYSLEYVYSHDDGKVFVFLDGRGISTVDITISETYFSKVYIDYSHWSNNHIGAAIDEFRIYDGVALHTENFEAPTKENYAEKTLELERNLFFAFDTTTESTITNNRKPLDRYISFPGVVGSYGLVPLETLAGKNIFTIEVKFSTTATASSYYNYAWKTIIGREIQNYWQDDFGLCVNNGKLCFWAEPKRGNSFASGTGGVLTDVSVNDGQVHSVAVVSKGISIDLYCDGELVGHGDVVNAQIPTDYKICLATNYNNQSSYLSMKFYEARLWSVARTQEDIFAQIDGNEEGLEAWYIPAYRTDIIPDLTGNERHITLYGDATADFIYELATEHEADIECSIFNESLSFGVGQEVAEGITVLEGLDASQSKTGTAFYQTTQKKCFHLPPMPEVWMEFDVYFDGSNRWRAFNGGANGVTGITAQASGNLAFFSNGSAVKNVAGVCRANELQTVRLHMITGITGGVIEAWVDGQIIYRYTGDVNHGDYFEDLYLQSDGAGTFFSNLYISNNGLPARRYLKRDFNMERRVSNKSMGWRVSFSELEQTALQAPPWLKIPPEKKPPDEQEWVTQAAIERCFDLSPTYDIWIDFDVYSGGVTVWRAGNVSPDYGICGIMSSIGGALNYLSNGETIQSFPGAYEPNEIQPVLLHMLSGVSDGIIETWVNGELIWQYVGDVNNGEDFCDLFLQADDDGAFFSNIVLSTERLTPRRRSLYPPIYLCVSYNGVPISYPFEYSEAPIPSALAVYWGGKEWYNKLVAPTSSKAGAVRVWHNSEEYALSVD